MRGNCVCFAVRLWARRRRKGAEGYIVWRASRLRAITGHVLYAERRRSGTLRVVHWCPIEKLPRWVPPPWFAAHGPCGWWVTTPFTCAAS